MVEFEQSGTRRGGRVALLARYPEQDWERAVLASA
jgi:hypothetical protein